jgi:cell division septum initiation protein DivIVA
LWHNHASKDEYERAVRENEDVQQEVHDLERRLEATRGRVREKLQELKQTQAAFEKAQRESEKMEAITRDQV